MTDSESITGKVAAIIDATTLVLNVGAEQGVTEGHLFAIVAPHGEVIDPDTGENLGLWESVKGRVVVTHVQPRMCTVRTPLVDEGPYTGTLSEMMVRHSFGLYGDHRQDRERLDVQAEGVAGRPRTPPIAVGDVARSISLQQLARAVRAVEDQQDLPSQTYTATRSRTAPEPKPAEESDAS